MTARTWTGVWILTCLVGMSCATSHERASDGKSNWLTACEGDDECGLGACVCGVCTVACDDDGDCARAGGPSAACVNPARDGIANACAAAVIDAHAGICLAACTHSSDCLSREQCLGGACLRASTADGAWEAARRDAGGTDPHAPIAALAPRNPDGSVPAENSGVLAPSSGSLGVAPVPGTESPDTDAGSPQPPVADASAPPSNDTDAGSTSLPVTDASAPPGIDASVSVIPCSTNANGTWSEPFSLAVNDLLSDVSVALDGEGHAVATWVAGEWNPALGAYDHWLAASDYEPGVGWSSPTTLASARGDGWVTGAKMVLNEAGVGFVAWMHRSPEWSAGQGVLMVMRRDVTGWVGSPLAIGAVNSDVSHLYAKLGVDAAGNAWLVWRPDDTQILGSRFTSSAGTWSTPIVLASGSPAPSWSAKHPAQDVFVNALGDAVLYWNTPTDYWARYYRDGTWWGARSVPNESWTHSFALGEDGVGVGWHTEATGDPGDPYRGRIRRFRADTGWDDGFTTPHHGYYRFQHYLTLDAVGTMLGVFGDEASQWTAFDVLPGMQTTQAESVVLASNEAAVMPGFDTNQHDVLVQHPSGQAFVGLGLEWSGAGGGTYMRQTWGRRYCTSVGWGDVEKVSGSLEADVVFAAAINASGQTVALLGGSTHTLWATVLE